MTYEEHHEAAWQAASPDIRALATVLHDADHDAAFCWYDSDCGTGGYNECEEERGGPKDHLDQARALVARGVLVGTVSEHSAVGSAVVDDDEADR